MAKRKFPVKRTPIIKDFVSTAVVGLEHHLKTREARITLYAKIYNGLQLRIVRERKNRFDKNACAVYLGKSKIGFLPRDHARDLAPRIDRGEPYFFFISWFRCEIETAGDSHVIKVTGLKV